MFSRNDVQYYIIEWVVNSTYKFSIFFKTYHKFSSITNFLWYYMKKHHITYIVMMICILNKPIIFRSMTCEWDIWSNFSVLIIALFLNCWRILKLYKYTYNYEKSNSNYWKALSTFFLTFYFASNNTDCKSNTAMNWKRKFLSNIKWPYTFYSN